MASLNLVQIIGHMGKNPETKFTPAGMQITKFSVATSRKVKKGDSYEEKSTWHNVVTFNNQAKFSADYLKKGHQVYIEGSTENSTWQDEQGKTHYKTEVLANSVQSLTPRTDNQQQNNNYQQSQQQQPNQPENTDNLPF